MIVHNTHPRTGVQYGYISANALDSEVVNALMYETGTDLSYREALVNLANRLSLQVDHFKYEQHKEAEEWLANNHDDIFDRWMQEYEDSEPIVKGTYEGVEYLSSWLGGALNFFILYSPYITERARQASPCVPNAAILDTLDGNVRGYNVPNNWRYNDETDS